MAKYPSSASTAVDGPQDESERGINMLHDIDRSNDTGTGNGSLDGEARIHQRQGTCFPLHEITPSMAEDDLTISDVTLNLSSPYYSTPHAPHQSSPRRSNLDSSLASSVTSFLSASDCSFDLSDSPSRNVDSLLNESSFLRESGSESKTVGEGKLSPSPLRRRHPSSFDPNCCWKGKESLERSGLWGSSNSDSRNGIALLRGSKFSFNSGATTKDSDETIEHSNSALIASASSNFLAPMSSGSDSLGASLNELSAARRDFSKSLNAIAENFSKLHFKKRKDLLGGRLKLGRWESERDED